jgi:hypothetical protein
MSRIRTELAFLDQEVADAVEAWNRARLSPEDDSLLLKAAALSLHSVYSGLERVFEQIARHVDQQLPDGDSWHRDLLFQMSEAREGVRPALISVTEAVKLQPYLGFRHVVRNIYTYNLMPARIEELIGGLTELWPRLRARLAGFADYLDGA